MGSTLERKRELTKIRQKRWRDTNKAMAHSLTRSWKTRNQEKIMAQRLVYNHPDRINIISECPCNNTNKVYHHFDYSKPYDVIKLCLVCHKAEHKRLRSLADKSVDDSSIPERPDQKRSRSKDATTSLLKGSVPAVGEASADQSPAPS